MNLISIKTLINYFAISFLLLFSSTNVIETKKEENCLLKKEKKNEEKNIKEDAKVIKDILLKFFEKQISEFGYFDKHVMNKIIDHICYQFAMYYNQLKNFQEDPQKSISIVIEFMNNIEVYTQAAAIYLFETEKDLTNKYNLIKNKYCTGFFERITESQEWKKLITFEEYQLINELESYIQEIRNILTIMNRTQLLLKLLDWTVNSYSPIAWLLRQCIGW